MGNSAGQLLTLWWHCALIQALKLTPPSSVACVLPYITSSIHRQQKVQVCYKLIRVFWSFALSMANVLFLISIFSYRLALPDTTSRYITGMTKCSSCTIFRIGAIFNGSRFLIIAHCIPETHHNLDQSAYIIQARLLTNRFCSLVALNITKANGNLQFQIKTSQQPGRLHQDLHQRNRV